MEVLVVDGANVMGSRPDGWWRDRAGAARRLHEQLSTADLPHDEVVLVLEGAGRGGHPAGRHGHVLTVHAPGSGDDTIVEAVAVRVAALDSCRVIVVTADRELQARVEHAGGGCRRPSWLLGQL